MKQLVMGSHRSEHWKPEEDMRLIELIEAGKSWVLISAILKRSVKTCTARNCNNRRATISQTNLVGCSAALLGQ